MKLDASSPSRATKRPDLTFLRHRSRPVRSANSPIAEFVAGRASAHANTRQDSRAATPPSPATAPPATVPPAVSAPARTTPGGFTGRPMTPAPASTPVPASSASSLDLFAPQQGNSLDLSEPAQAPQAARAPSSSSTSLDLSGPAPAPVRSTATRSGSSSTSLDLGAQLAPPVATARPGSSTSLDLGAAPVVRPSPPTSSGATSLDLSPATQPRPAAAAIAPVRQAQPGPGGARSSSRWREPRTSAEVSTILTAHSPTVTLTRVQSGVGTLTVEAVAAPGIGDLRLGCAYQLASGRSSTVQHQAGRRYAPPGETRRPLVLAARQQFERVEFDLRQVVDLERCVVYAFSGDGRQLQWGGTLVVSTFGGDRIELPIELAPSDAVAVLASIYNIGGQLVLRSEMDLIGRTIREACRGYGFDRITWLDDRTPID